MTESGGNDRGCGWPGRLIIVDVWGFLKRMLLFIGRIRRELQEGVQGFCYCPGKRALRMLLMNLSSIHGCIRG
jgi:hypothetical protein